MNRESVSHPVEAAAWHAVFARLHHSARILLGLESDDNFVPDDERKRIVLTLGLVGLILLLLASVLYLMSDEAVHHQQGWAYLALSLFLLLPVVVMTRLRRQPKQSEYMVAFSGVVIYATVIAFGGLTGDGAYWSFAFPYAAFLMTGQRGGWLIGLGFGLGMPVLMVYTSTLPGLWVYGRQHSMLFGLAYLANVLVAAHFNLLRSSFQRRLWEQVALNTQIARERLERLEYDAIHDRATDLPNRQGMLRIIDEALSGREALGPVMVVSLHFERAIELAARAGIENVHLGLQRLVAVLREKLPGLIGVGRSRLDEIGLVLMIEDGQSADDAIDVLLRLHDMPEIGDFSIHDETNFGVAIAAPGGSPSAADLMRQAELAQLFARHQGLVCQYYDAPLEEHFRLRHSRYEKIRIAVLDNRLALHYQPQIDLRSGAVVGAEALARWFDPEEAWIEPDVFIPIIESTGLLDHFSVWTVQQAIADCAAWQEALPGVAVSINLSAGVLHDFGIVGIIRRALAKHGLEARLVMVELTESVMLKSPEAALATMQELVALGLRLSIDDYGAGFSSLSYVKQLPARELKIDKSFVLGLPDNVQDRAIIQSTIDLGHAFGLAVLAEGVETAAVRHVLAELGCDLGQGWLFARAMPRPEFVEWANGTAIH